jgi:ABC-type phosphate transport system auxiliary subunit
MSVLDDFERMRLYRKRAAEFQWLADNALVPSVQRRYRTIARHYNELADREEQSDKARMVERIERLRLKRKEAAKRTSLSAESDARFFLIAAE